MLPANAAKDQQVETLAASGRLGFRHVLGQLGRDELRLACRVHQIDDSGRARPELAARLLQAYGVADSTPPAPLFAGRASARDVPQQGDIVRCRHRQWLVQDVTPPPGPEDAVTVTVIHDACASRDRRVRRRRHSGGQGPRRLYSALGIAYAKTIATDDFLGAVAKAT